MLIYLAFISCAYAATYDEIWHSNGATDPRPGDRDLRSPLLQFNPSSRFLREFENSHNVVTAPSLNPNVFNINRSYPYRSSREHVENAAHQSSVLRSPNDPQLNGRLPYLMNREPVEDIASLPVPQTLEGIHGATNPLIWSESSANSNMGIAPTIRREPTEDSGLPEHDYLRISDSLPQAAEIRNSVPFFNPYARNRYGLRREAVEDMAMPQISDNIVMLPRTTVSVLWSNPPTLDSSSGPHREPVEDVALTITSPSQAETYQENMRASELIPIARIPNRLHREAVEDIILPVSSETIGLPRSSVYNQPILIHNTRNPHSPRREAVEDLVLPITSQPSESINTPIQNSPSSSIGSTPFAQSLNNPTEPQTLERSWDGKPDLYVPIFRMRPTYYILTWRN